MNEFFERFNSLSERERIIIIVTLLVGIWATWDNLIYQPLAVEKKQLASELSNIDIQLTTQQQAAEQIKALGEMDPNQVNKQTLSRVKSELKKLKQQLDIGDKQFVPSHLMAKVLHDMLKKDAGLKLIKLETLPVTTLSESTQQRSWIYRHGLSITLSGNYFNTLSYLKSLEALPWRFNWGNIKYQVKEYPLAETTFTVYTLSFEESWLGL